jgi:vancomycin resistance protein VanJ
MRRALRIVLALTVLLYAIGMCVWYILRAFYADTLEWLALVNTFALYLFLPLWLFLVLIVSVRRYALLPLLGLPFGLFLFLFGTQWIPHASLVDSTQPTLKVMTFNVNGNTSRPDLATARIEAEDADVVLIQELSQFHSYSITSRLQARYPYRQLEPLPGRRGIGILSRYPVQDQGWVKLGRDSNAAQRIRLDWQGRSVQIFNVHLESTVPGENVIASFREREQQVQQLLTLVASENVPTIVAGDFNLTDTTYAYSMLAHELHDAHREVGCGLGLTFPSSPALVRRVLLQRVAQVFQTRDNVFAWLLNRVYIPPFPVLRIDYLFSTPSLRATKAYTAAWDGQSDHQAVIATFQLSSSGAALKFPHFP